MKADAFQVDAFELARQGREVSGSIALVRLLRLTQGLPEQSGDACWQVRGGVGRGTGRTGVISGQPLLYLQARADLTLECQRCGQLFVFPINAENTLQLVQSEADLEEPEGFGRPLGALQEECDESPSFAAGFPEKVVGSRQFDLLAQVEDELILNVPYIPRHDVCPGVQASAGAVDQPAEAPRPSPFAVLESLKRKP